MPHVLEVGEGAARGVLSGLTSARVHGRVDIERHGGKYLAGLAGEPLDIEGIAVGLEEFVGVDVVAKHFGP